MSENEFKSSEIIKAEKELTIEQKSASFDREKILKERESMGIDEINISLYNVEVGGYKYKMEATVKGHKIEILSSHMRPRSVDYPSILNISGTVDGKPLLSEDASRLWDIYEKLDWDYHNYEVDTKIAVERQKAERIKSDQEKVEIRDRIGKETLNDLGF